MATANEEQDGELARLRASEARVRRLAEAIPQLVWTSLADGRWDWAGPQWCRYTGLNEAESLGVGWLAAVHPDDRAAMTAAWSRATSSGQELLDVDVRIRRAADGVWRWFQTRATPLPADDAAAGTSPPGLRWFGTFTDVDDLKRAEAALRELNRTLEQRVAERTAERDRLWRFSRDLLVVVNADGAFSAVSPAAEAILGRPPEQMVGQRLLDFVHPDDRAGTGSALASVAPGAWAGFDGRMRHSDGGWRRIAWIGVGEGDLLYATGRDVTAERAAADALRLAQEQLHQSQKVDALGQLTGGIAHDFNNMLQTVAGGLGLMRMRIGQGRANETIRYLDVAQQGVDRAASLTQRLLAFARRQALDPRPLSPDALVRDVAEILRRTVGPTVQVALRLGDGGWRVLCDENQLESALLNLAINARDAMPEGGTLTLATASVAFDQADVSAQEGGQPGEYVEIAVTDTGLGMPAEVLARAFEPFFTTKPLGVGTGLGLSQVHGFVRQSGGFVRLDSAPSRGTTVRLFLPRIAADGAPGGAVAGTGRTPPRTGRTILLVEDEGSVRDLVVEALRETGHTVVHASDAPGALRALEGGARPDVLVTDVGLPGPMNGRQLADALRERLPSLPVLFITGYAGNVFEGQLAPGMELLTKPFALHLLTDRVREMLARRD